jgi:hypothetical protein
MALRHRARRPSPIVVAVSGKGRTTTRRSLEERLNALSAPGEGNAEEARVVLAEALASTSASIVARAAKIAAKRNLDEMLRTVEGALDRFLRLPPEKDRGCLAKIALVEACDELRSARDDLFLVAVRTVHIDPGRKTDLAAGMRARSLYALFRLQHPKAMAEAARLLADGKMDARIGAARALRNGLSLAVVPLLRYKAHIGDEDDQVIEEVLATLLAVDPDESIELVAELLDSPDEPTSDLAAMALGASHLEAAAAPLSRWTEALPERRLRVAFSALAILRTERAIDQLLVELRDAAVERAILAAQALAPFAYDDKLMRRAREAAAGRTAVLAAFDEAAPQSDRTVKRKGRP